MSPDTGKVFMSITAAGREGIWRLQNFDFRASTADVEKGMEDDLGSLQPENDNFFLVEIQIGKLINARAMHDIAVKFNRLYIQL